MDTIKRPMPSGMIFPSATGGDAHVVTVMPFDPPIQLACGCKAMLSLAFRPKGCWAMQEFRRMTGITEPAATVVEAEVEVPHDAEPI